MIAVLVTALVGPLFIDWTAYRATFERQAEQLIGREVKILGEADMFLLPTPAVTFTDMRIGDAENPLMIVSRFSARVELAPLLKGEVRVIDMTLERPDLRLVLDGDGKLTTFGEDGRSKDGRALDPADVAFEEIEIIDGSVQLSDARSAQVHRLTDVDLSIAARALIGPFKADGSLLAGGSQHKIKIATGKLRGDGGIRVKLQVTPAAHPAELLLDGIVSANGLKPKYAGTFVLERDAPPPDDEAAVKTAVGAARPDPWRVEGSFDIADSALGVDGYELTYGPEDRRFNVSGAGKIDFGADMRFDVSVQAQQIDLDRMLAPKKGASPVDAAATVEALFAGLRRIPEPAIDGKISFDLPGVVVAGGAIQNLRFAAITTSKGWFVSDLKGRLPGRSSIELNGDIGLRQSVAFDGNLTLSVEQPAALAGWWRGGGLLAGATLDPLEVRGRLTIGQTGVSLTEARLRTDLSLGSGNVSWQPARPGRRARFGIELDADRFELEQLGAATRLALAGYRQEGGGVTDVGVQVRVGKLITDDVEASGVELAVGFSGDTLTIDRMILADLAGARIIADGEIKNVLTTPDGDLKLDLTADKLGGIATLIVDLFPNSGLARRLTNASDLLGPAIVSATFTGREAGDASTATLDVSGEVGGSELKVLGTFAGRVDKWQEANVGLDASLKGPNGSRVLAQLGFDVLPIADLPLGRIAVSAKGQPDAGLAVDLDVDVAGTALALEGVAAFPADGAMFYGFEGKVTSADLTPLALVTGRVLPITAGKVAADLSATLDGGASAFTVTELTGSIAGVTVAGSGAVDIGGDTPKAEGALTIDALDLRFLTELAFGADSWASVNGSADRRFWPSAPFGAPLLGFVSADLRITTERLWLTGATALDKAGFRLDLTPNGLALDGVTGRLLGGDATAALQIKRSDEGEAVMSAALRIRDGDLTGIVWRDDDGPRATGRFDFAVDTNSTGRSIAALLSALAGGGTLTVREGTVKGINPGAFPAVVAAVDGGLELENAAVRAAFLQDFSEGQFAFDTMETVLSIASGTIRARNMSLAAEDVRALGSATLDLNDFSFESDWTIGVEPDSGTVAGAEPQVVLRYEGEVADPAMAVDIDPFMSYLTLRAYEQEVDRVEALQAEILERDRLTRELRRLREDRAKREAEERKRRIEEDAARAAAAAAARRDEERRAREALESILPDTPRPAAEPLTNDRPGRSGNLADRIRPILSEPQPSGSLAPLPKPIDVGPAPGGLSGTEALPGFAPRQPTGLQPVERQPLQLLPAEPPAPVAAQARQPRTPAKPRQRYITTTGGRIITMPEYDPDRAQAIETTGDRIIMMPQ